MRQRTALAAAVLAVGVVGVGAETAVPLANGGFEDGLSGWTVPAGEGMSTLSTERAASGTHALRIADGDPVKGSDVASGRVAVPAAGAYELRGQAWLESGGGLGVYVRLLGRDGAPLPGEPALRGLEGTDRAWRRFTLTAYAPAEAAWFQVWLHSYSKAQVTGFLDDLAIVQLGPEAAARPWPAQYKLRPDERGRLTAADVVGPDGVVYPNWTQCGVPGGIPDVPVAARLEGFDGRADDDADDADALDRACQAVGQRGGGAVLLGAGTYVMDRPVTIRHDGVVIRGAGAAKTRLVFRYGLPAAGAAFYALPTGSTIGPKTAIELHCLPAGLERMRIQVDERTIAEWARSTHSGNTFNLTRRGSDIVGKVADGPRVLRGIGEYKDGATRSVELPVTVSAAFDDTRAVASSSAVLLFNGSGWVGPKRRLARDGKRGDRALELDSAEGLAAGDRVTIDGPATARWKALTKNACQWGTYRRYAAVVEAVAGNTVRLNQPLRIEFPAEDGATLQKVVPIRRCGVEDLTLEQTQDLWISAVVFAHGWECWARGVTVRTCGRFPVYGREAKWCEIRNCVFDDAWFKGGGGTAYGGWEDSYDCLIDGLETFRLRHAPLFQWAASGCVIRNGVFHQSDGQWHSGWTNENLFENCVIESTSTANGGYGFGLWASPPEDTAHGPNGPRNVIYNCDMQSLKAGLWMGGMNENWLVLYNRFTVAKGEGVFAKTASVDHVVRGNVFVLRDGASPMVRLATPDCVGVELIGNRVYGGNGQFCAGAAGPAVATGNEALPLAEAPRPTPAVPSIFDWQRANVK